VSALAKQERERTNGDAAVAKRMHLPYRDSPLTLLLRRSLGGACRVALVACVSAAWHCMSETASTLQFARRAAGMRSRAVVNSTTSASLSSTELSQLLDDATVARDEALAVAAAAEAVSSQRASELAAMRAAGEQATLAIVASERRCEKLETQVAQFVSLMRDGAVGGDGALFTPQKSAATSRAPSRQASQSRVTRSMRKQALSNSVSKAPVSTVSTKKQSVRSDLYDCFTPHKASSSKLNVDVDVDDDADTEDETEDEADAESKTSQMTPARVSAPPTTTATAALSPLISFLSANSFATTPHHAATPSLSSSSTVTPQRSANHVASSEVGTCTNYTRFFQSLLARPPCIFTNSLFSIIC
jgi:hypothetical protein